MVTDDLHTVRLCDFGDGDAWTATGRPTYESLQVRTTSGPQRTSDDSARILGIHVRAEHDHRGYNIFEVEPPTPLVLPEQTTTVTLWVWGSNYDYSLEAHFANDRDEYSIKPMGSLHFSGWRRLALRFSSPLAGTRFLKFVIRTAPIARVHRFEIYLDEFTATTA